MLALNFTKSAPEGNLVHKTRAGGRFSHNNTVNLERGFIQLYKMRTSTGENLVHKLSTCFYCALSSNRVIRLQVATRKDLQAPSIVET